MSFPIGRLNERGARLGAHPPPTDPLNLDRVSVSISRFFKTADRELGVVPPHQNYAGRYMQGC